MRVESRNDSGRWAVRSQSFATLAFKKIFIIDLKEEAQVGTTQIAEIAAVNATGIGPHVLIDGFGRAGREHPAKIDGAAQSSRDFFEWG